MLSEWGFSLIAEAAAAFGNPFDVFDTSEHFKSQTASRARPSLTHMLFPDEQFRSSAELNPDRGVMLVGDPAADVAYLQMVYGHTRENALRYATAGATLLYEARAGLRLVIDERRISAADAVRAILEHFGWPTDGQVANDIFTRFAGPDPHDALSRALDWIAYDDKRRESRQWSPPPTDAAVIEGAIEPLFAAATTGRRRPLTWTRECFLDGDNPGKTLPVRIEATGPSRILSYGPYWHIPGGRWRATVTVGFSNNATGTPFSIDVICREPCAIARVTPGGAGMYNATFEFTLPVSIDPVEVRLVMTQGAIFGQVALSSITFDPIETSGTPATAP